MLHTTKSLMEKLKLSRPTINVKASLASVNLRIETHNKYVTLTQTESDQDDLKVFEESLEDYFQQLSSLPNFACSFRDTCIVNK